MTVSLLWVPGTYNKIDNFAAPICTALKKKWRSTIKTTTQFPEDRGTLVELACSDTDAVFKGNNVITCIHGRDFNFSKDPKCSISGMFYTNQDMCLNIISDNVH